MPTYVCNFCGGDHGAETCRETVSYQGEELSAVEVIENMLDFLGHELSEEQWQQVKANYDNDQPIEMLAYIVANFSDSFNDVEIKSFFPPAKDDGKIYNATRKHGNCFEFAYTYLLDSNSPHLADPTLVDLDDGELVLVHGFVLTNPTEYTGHAWLETDNHAIDCGSMRKRLKISDKETFYKYSKVKSPKKFKLIEAANLLLDLDHFGPWIETPEDIPMCSAWSK